jgi:RNA polymerase sigma factor (sigma-70 family)
MTLTLSDESTGSTSQSKAADAANEILLRRFAKNGDGAAFAELVRRLGPMVLGVCRRSIADYQLAEDAMQAVFLVLARKPDAVRAPGTVGGFLYGVAVRIAQKARTMKHRRGAREVVVSQLPDFAGRVNSTYAHEPCDPDLLRALDEEVARLPAVLRDAVVECELSGASRAQAADRLGIPQGTLSSRLARARKMLATRLKKRGMVLPIAGLAVLSQASLSQQLFAQTSGVMHSTVSPIIGQLSRGVFSMMLLEKLKLLVLIMVGLGLSAAVVRESMRPSAGGDVELIAEVDSPVAAQEEASSGGVLVWRKGSAQLLDAHGKKLREWSGDAVADPGAARLAPDGKSIAVLAPYDTRALVQKVSLGTATFKRHLFRIAIYDVAEKFVGKEISLPCDSIEAIFWSGDGAKLYAATHADEENNSHDVNLKHYVVEVKTGEHSELSLPSGHHLKAVSPDGKHFLTTGPLASIWEVRGVFLISEGKAPVRLNDAREVLYDAEFSSDGKRVLMTGVLGRAAAAPKPADAAPGVPPPVAAAVTGWLVHLPVDDPAKRVELTFDEREYANQCRWSPDGKRIVTSRQVLPIINQPPAPREIVITDLDGGNRHSLTKDTGKYLEPVFLDWR